MEGLLGTSESDGEHAQIIWDRYQWLRVCMFPHSTGVV